MVDVKVRQRLIRRIRKRLPQFGADWTQQEPTPPRRPSGWEIGPPDFVGVGAQKAGTTWWYHLIAAHPDVHHDPEQKPERHFFDRYGMHSGTAEIERYHRLFPRPPGKKIGEKTPEYMACYWVPALLHEAAPDARLFAILRDPVERYRSAMQQADRAGWRRDRQLEMVMFDFGLYARQVQRLLDAYDREHILLLQYERCVAQPAAEIEKTYAFLGLAPRALAENDLREGRNVTRGGNASMDSERRALLRRLYQDDVSELVKYVPELDLSLWPNFRNMD